jgi:methyl-accepting chemotaxis protein
MINFQLTLTQRVFMTIALLVSVFLVVCGFTAYAIFGIQKQASQTIDADLTQLVRMAGIQQNLLQVRRAEKDISIDLLMKMERVPQRIAEWKKNVSDATTLLNAALASESDPILRQMLKDGLASQARYTAQVGGTIQKIERQEILDQAIFEMEIEKPAQSAMTAEAQIIQAIEQNKQHTTHGGKMINEAVSQLTWIVGIGVLFAVCSGAIFGLMLMSRIRQPLEGLTEGIRRVKSGDLSRAVVVQSQDELGMMSHDFNDMIHSLQSMVSQVRHAADNITGASSQIASGNFDLSTRTEQAAASLQQAAASLSDLTSTVQQTAESAHSANEIATSAATSAEQGGDLVMQVVSSMHGIKASSRKIADIIAVIDSISFQTNILALNAAVEAARAGEQGQGFAVVASEVRRLAQRSAQAAREIKSLIESSQLEVETGSRLVLDAGKAMKLIVENVTNVSGMIRAITHASRAQSSGIGQVNQSMAELEQMTQQNSALVEEAAAASASLKEQADRMAEAMRMFAIREEIRPPLQLA